MIIVINQLLKKLYYILINNQKKTHLEDGPFLFFSKNYFPLTNGRPVFGLSTTCFPAGRSHAFDLESLAK